MRYTTISCKEQANYEAGQSVQLVFIYGFAQGAGGIAIAAKTVYLFHGPYLGRNGAKSTL